MAMQHESGDTSASRTFALVAAGSFAFIALFQLAIALGAPSGAAAAWGGERNGQLPTSLRLGSIFATVFWSVAALTVLSRGGVSRSPVPSRVANIGTRVLVDTTSARLDKALPDLPGSHHAGVLPPLVLTPAPRQASATWRV